MNAATYERAVQSALADGRYDVVAELRRQPPRLDGAADMAAACLKLALSLGTMGAAGGAPGAIAGGIGGCIAGGFLSYTQSEQAELLKAEEAQRQRWLAAAKRVKDKEDAKAAKQVWTWAAVAGVAVLGGVVLLRGE